jgi:monomeric isocitrate dehydrogenase
MLESDTGALRIAPNTPYSNWGVGREIDLGGYYYPDREKAIRAMRSSETFNNAIEYLD